MDIKDYRKRYEAELAAAEATVSGVGSDSPLREASRQLNNMLQLPQTASLSERIPALLTVLKNPAQPTLIRKAAVHALQAAQFLSEAFAPFRADFLNALRTLITPDTDADLRTQALEILAEKKDLAAQDLLKKGLRDPQSALVPATKALQFLSYDDHAGISDLALQVFETADNLPVKEAALRALAADAKSQDLFQRLLQDKTQPQSLRALSATGLYLLNPQKFADVARKIVMDHSENEDIRATTLGALANVPERHALHHDPDLLEHVQKLGADSSLKDLRAAAIRMLTKP
jgi:hypothetical protein